MPDASHGIARQPHVARPEPAPRWAVVVVGLGGTAVLVVVAVLASAVLAREWATREPVAKHLVEPARVKDWASPHEELEHLRARETTLLGGYGWVDRSEGIVRVPIERAMTLVVEGRRATPPASVPTPAPVRKAPHVAR